MQKFLKSLSVSIAIFLEVLKSFLIMCLVIVAIFVALSSIIHNVFKIREIYSQDKTGYKNFVTVKTNRMNVQVTGEGDRTAVILSSFGTPSPIIQYKTYANFLASNGYRVVILEYFGYGYSLSSKEPRTVDNIVSEINMALEASEIYGPFTFIANGTSGLYAEAYENAFPGSIERLVLIDSVYPATIKEKFMKEHISDEEFNVTLTSVAELSGYARILSYVNPSMFGIDKMKEYGFSKDDITFYRKMIANRFYTSTMVKEYKALADNMEKYKDYTFPDYLNVTQILSSEYIEEFENYKKEKLLNKDLEEYANDMITNEDIQKVVVVEGEKENLNISNPEEVEREFLNFLNY